MADCRRCDGTGWIKEVVKTPKTANGTMVVGVKPCPHCSILEAIAEGIRNCPEERNTPTHRLKFAIAKAKGRHVQKPGVHGSFLPPPGQCIGLSTCGGGCDSCPAEKGESHEQVQD